MRQTACVLWGITFLASFGGAAEELEAPAEVSAGSFIEVQWSGDPQAQDYITLVAADAADGTYKSYVYVSSGNPVTLRAPDEPGRYQLRYQSDSRAGVFARHPFTVVANSATLSAPASVVMGSEIPVTWTGPDNSGDYITIVAAGAADRTWKNYTYTTQGSPLTIRAPEETGEYEIRYANGQSNTTLAAIPLIVSGATASLEAPATAVAGSFIKVTWRGPDNPGDYVTVVPVGTADGQWDDYEFTSWGNPLSLTTADRPGEYEVRYATGQSNITLARAPVTLTPASASLTVPASAVAGTGFNVGWEGPGNPSDFVAIVPIGAAEGTWINYAGVGWGPTLRLVAPLEDGPYELRYVTGRSYTTLARAPIEVTPGRAPAVLRVQYLSGKPSVSSAAVFELILDASGSMLKRDRGDRRIEIARSALIDLVERSLPNGATVALRVFGHIEPNACRTDLVTPAAPLNRGSLSATIGSIEARNLARTPIGASLAKVSSDLEGIEGPVNVILVTDGEETCDGDAAKAIADLKSGGINVQVNIVGFAIDDVMLKETFREWARLGNGRYFDAGDLDELTASLTATLDLRFEVIDPAGNRVTLGSVNGPAVELTPGEYRVRLVGAPKTEAKHVSLLASEERTVDF